MFNELIFTPDTTLDDAIEGTAIAETKGYHSQGSSRRIVKPDKVYFGIELELMYEDPNSKSRIPEYYFRKYGIEFYKENDATVHVEYITHPIEFSTKNLKELSNCINDIINYQGRHPGVYISDSTGLHLSISTNNLIDSMTASKETKDRMNMLINEIADAISAIDIYGRDFNGFATKDGDFFGRRSKWVSHRNENRLEFRLLTFRSKEQFVRAVKLSINITELLTRYAEVVISRAVTRNYTIRETTSTVTKEIKSMAKSLEVPNAGKSIII